MPEMPAFLANLLEPRFARAATVMAVEELAPRLRRVRFAGPALRGVSFRAGQEIGRPRAARADPPPRPRRRAARVAAADDLAAVHNDACFYLAGHATTIVRLRSTSLLAGWPKRSIRTKGYWAEGKRGM